MAKYLQVKDEAGLSWLVEQGDPLWEFLTPARDAHYEMWQLTLPTEVACHLRVNKPNYNRVDMAIENGETLDAIGTKLLVEDIRKVIGE